MIRHLRHLYSAGIETIERRSNTFIGGEAAHGLEQQLIEALVECLSNGSVIEATRSTIEHHDVALRFEALLQAEPERALRMAETCSALGVSARDLRLACEEQLGMGPVAYARRRRMQQADRASGPPRMRGRCEFEEGSVLTQQEALAHRKLVVLALERVGREPSVCGVTRRVMPATRAARFP
jgi:hypothetical protein